MKSPLPLVLLLAALPLPLLALSPAEQSAEQPLVGSLTSAYDHLANHQPFDWAAQNQALLAFAAKYPANPDAVGLVKNAMYAFEQANPLPTCARAWAAFAASPNFLVASAAETKTDFFALAEKPVALTFTALDGRPVDLQQLRGKVVLLDFWATWCGPCMQELPNVKRIYAAYHAQGFEIVGISCDVAPERGGNQPWTKTGPDVLAFTQANGMPWPQHYEGRKHNEGGNSLALRFAVTGIPAGFLLDKDGRIAALGVRGERLEQEVQRLLKTPAGS
jgi:thiol-disulfide isomerase/thioredoxin